MSGPQITTENIRMHRVESSNLVAIGFRLDTSEAKRLLFVNPEAEEQASLAATDTLGTMRIRFKGGRTYEYRKVPVTLYALIANAPSHGEVFATFKTSPWLQDYHQVEEES